MENTDARWETSDGGHSEWIGTHRHVHHNQQRIKWNSDSYVFTVHSKGTINTNCVLCGDLKRFKQVKQFELERFKMPQCFSWSDLEMTYFLCFLL